MKQNTIEWIGKYKIIAIVRGLSKEKILPTAKALYQGGIRLIEVTFNQASPTAIEDTTTAIKAIREAFEDRLCVGAGTVLTEEQGKAAFESGAKYLISPHTDVKLIQLCTQLGMVSIPGALTPTEIVLAHESGADYVKLFPAGDLGLSYIKALRAPLNHIPLLGVGGVDEKNIQKFLACGLCGVGIGSNIVKADAIRDGNFEKITELAKLYTQAIQ